MRNLFKRFKRAATIKNKTRETDIRIDINLDGSGKYKIDTGIGFLNHMLELFAFHGKFDLKIKASGDLDVDIHHTNEDIGIALGEALAGALGDKEKIKRFGNFYVPMDEALVSVRVVLDISDRPSSNINMNNIGLQEIKEYKSFDLRHFLDGFVRKAGINLHIDVLKGEDTHHIFEAIFKALAKALSEAVEINPKSKGIPSTKGKL